MVAQISRFLVYRIAGHLRHPLLGGMPRDARQAYASGLQMQEKQNVVRHQTSPRQHLDREEIGSGEHVHMPTDELLPGRRLTPFGSRCDVVAAQDVAYSLVRNMMAEVRQRAGNAVVTPARVLAGEANHQILDLWTGAGSARIGTGSRTIELAGDKPPIPSENGVWFGHTGDLLQSFASESLADLGKRATLRIRQAQPRWQVCAENPVLRSQVLVLQQQFLVDQPRYIRQQTSPLIAVHANCPSSQVSGVRRFVYFDRSGKKYKKCCGA